MPSICISAGPPDGHCHPPQMEIVLTSWLVPRLFITACKGCLPGAPPGYGISLTTVPHQAGLQLPNSEGARSLDVTIHMANQVQFCPAANQDQSMQPGSQHWQDNQGTPNVATRGSSAN